MRVATCADIPIDAPIELADGNEYSAAMSLHIDYVADLNGDDACEGAVFDLDDVTIRCVALDVAGIELTLCSDDEARVFHSYLAVPKNRERLERRLCDEWERVGYQRWLNDCSERRSEMRRAI